MLEKYSLIQMQLLSEVLSGKKGKMEILPLISDEKMRKKAEYAIYKYEELSNNQEISEEEFNEEMNNIPEIDELIENVFLEFAQRTNLEHLKYVLSAANTRYIDAIIHHPEFYEDGLNPVQIEYMIIATGDVDFMEECISDNTINLDEFGRENIGDTLYKMFVKSIDDEYYDEEKFEKYDDFDDKVDNPDYVESTLDKITSKIREEKEYTYEEKRALKIYEGASEDKGVLALDSDAYKTINSMFFPDIDNEVARIFEDGSYLNDNAIRKAEELLACTLNMYLTMYKYGQKMNKSAHVLRIDRAASFPVMEERGETVSNFSTSLQDEFNESFKKAHMVLVEAEIEPGAVCVDFEDVLKSDYRFSKEREILVAPFSPVTIEDIELTESDMKIRDRAGKPPERKVKMIVKASEKAKPLSDEEKAEKEEMYKIFNDPKIREEAAKFLEALSDRKDEMDSKSDHDYSRDHILEKIDPNLLQSYLDFKKAFQTIYRYETREIALTIEQGYIVKPRSMDFSNMKRDSSIDINTQLSPEEMIDFKIGDSLYDEEIKEIDEFLDEFEKQIKILTKTRTTKGIETAIDDLGEFINKKDKNINKIDKSFDDR